MSRLTGLHLLLMAMLVLCPAAAHAQKPSWEKLYLAGQEAYTRGDFARAEKSLSLAVAQAEQFGPADDRLAVSLGDLATVYLAQGKNAEAEPLFKRSLAIHEKALGPEHNFVSTALNNLALVYTNLGKYAQAEPLYKRSLAIAEKAMGPDHPNLARIMGSYAELLQKANRTAEAEEMQSRANAIRARNATKPKPLL